jgi:hypothetical protein
MARDPARTSRLETLGAWLGLWTAPRDVYVPPVPWRRVGYGALALVALGVVTALVVAPAIDDAKREGAAEERRAEERRAAVRRERQREEQRARTGRLPGARAARGPERARPIDRAAAVSFVEAEIGADAKARFGTPGDLAVCEPAPGQDDPRRRVVFDCVVTVRAIEGAGEQEGARGALAIPYRAALDFAAGRYAFCKANPRPGEAALAQADDVVDLPAACRVR